MPLLPAQVKMFMPMGLMFVYNKFGQEWEAPPLRLVYATTQVLSVLAYAYIYYVASKHASQTEMLTVKSKQATGPEKEEKLSIRKYDMKEARAAMQQLVMGATFVIGIHSWKGYLQPLVIQAVMGMFLLVDNPLFRIYVLGQQPVGDLQRPFKKDVSPLAALMGQGVGETEAEAPPKDGTAQPAKPAAAAITEAAGVTAPAAGKADAAPLRKRPKQ